jgi:thiamine biosynthesis protein ThiS
MKIILNGKERESEKGMTVAQLLETMGLKDRPVAVEVNKRIVRKQEHGQFELRDGDKVEVVTFVQGG